VVLAGNICSLTDVHKVSGNLYVNPEPDHFTRDIDLPFSIRSHIGICKLAISWPFLFKTQRLEIDTRILLTLLLDKSVRPSHEDMKL
jgi:hypothetical protein